MCSGSGAATTFSTSLALEATLRITSLARFATILSGKRALSRENIRFAARIHVKVERVMRAHTIGQFLIAGHLRSLQSPCVHAPCKGEFQLTSTAFARCRFKTNQRAANPKMLL